MPAIFIELIEFQVRNPSILEAAKASRLGTPRNQTQETAFLVKLVWRLRFLVFEFAV